MTLSPEQIARRREGISASEMAAIVGLDPYRSPIDVFLDKTGRAAPFAGNERTHWGNLLEDPIRNDYATRRGLLVTVPGTLDHPTLPWAKATPDGVCYMPDSAYPCRGLEIKTHSFRVAHLYGEPGTDEVPSHELIQCMWNMFVTGLDVWDLVSFIDGQPADYVIRRDDELIDTLRDRAERFLVDNVKADNPPEPDGSESYGKFLSTRYPHRSDAPYLAIDNKPALLADVAALRSVRAELDRLETEEATIEQRLKVAIGHLSGLEWTEDKKKVRIHYKLAKDGEKTDWESAYVELVKPDGSEGKAR